MGSGRRALLSEWANQVVQAAVGGQLAGHPLRVDRVELIEGPRAGAIELGAGLDTGRLLRVLAADDCALARQFVPWPFAGQPSVYLSGRLVRIEAGWPSEMADTTIRLAALGSHPRDGGRWIVGRNELGQTVTMGLGDRTPHVLLAGTTGSGKSVALRGALLQLSRDAQNRLILVDGKAGEGLAPCSGLRGVVGPVATSIEEARAALGYAVRTMQERYERGGHDGRLVVAVDEFQELTGDALVVESLRRLVAQGRAAGVHCLMATQHPAVGVFGDPIVRRNLVGRLALLVMDYDASKVAIGAPTPRADRLLGAGDAYAVVPGRLHRVQVAYVDDVDLSRAEHADPELEEWAAFEAESLGRDVPVGWSYSGQELGCALLSASAGEGRVRLAQRLEAAGLGRPGHDRVMRLLKLAREQLAWLGGQGVMLCNDRPSWQAHTRRRHRNARSGVSRGLSAGLDGHGNEEEAWTD